MPASCALALSILSLQKNKLKVLLNGTDLIAGGTSLQAFLMRKFRTVIIRLFAIFCLSGFGSPTTPGIALKGLK